MDTGSQWAIILALAGTLSTVVGAAFRYLLKELSKRDEALMAANASTAAANETNARLAELWITQHSGQTDGPRPSSSRPGR